MYIELVKKIIFELVFTAIFFACGYGFYSSYSARGYWPRIQIPILLKDQLARMIKLHSQARWLLDGTYVAIIAMLFLTNSLSTQHTSIFILIPLVACLGLYLAGRFFFVRSEVKILMFNINQNIPAPNPGLRRNPIWREPLISILLLYICFVIADHFTSLWIGIAAVTILRIIYQMTILRTYDLSFEKVSQLLLQTPSQQIKK